MRIILNDHIYELVPGSKVSRSPKPEWPSNMRLDGQQQRKDRSDMSSWAIDQWYNGLGLQHYNVDLASRIAGLWDVENCDTRWDSFICLSPKWQDVTISPGESDLNYPVNFLGDLYFFDRSKNFPIESYKFTAPNTLGSYKSITTGSYSHLKGLAVVDGRIVFAAYLNGADEKLVDVSSIGGAAHSIGAMVNNLNDAYISDVGGTIHVISTETDRDKVFFQIASKARGALTNVATISIQSVSSYGAQLVGDGTQLYANLPEAIYDFDESPSVLVKTTSNAEYSPRQIMFRNNHYFKSGYSFIKHGTTLDNKGYDRKDGVPRHLFGEITCLYETFKWAFAAVEGASYSHILTMDESNIWQYYARIPSMGRVVRKMILSDQDDDIERLFCLLDDGTIGFYLNPMIDPRLAATYTFVGTGYFTMPHFDGGMIEEPGAFYDMNVAGDDISEVNRITCLYGLNGADPTSTLGIIGTVNSMLMYGSPYGVEGYRIQPKFMLEGESSGTSPFFHSAILHYLKIPNEREQYGFDIDLVETSRQQTRPIEELIEDLNTARRSKVLIPFQYGRVGTKAVKITDMPCMDEIEFERIYDSERKGDISVTVSELR